MVLPDSNGITRVPPYSGATRETGVFRLQGYHLLWPAFPDRFDYIPVFLLSGATAMTPVWTYNPERATPAGLHALGLGCSAFARHYLRSLY
jgi:hypothetical protein